MPDLTIALQEWTALVAAIKSSKHKSYAVTARMVAMLVAAGANVNAVDEKVGPI